MILEQAEIQQVSINGDSIENVDKYKYLGTVINANLSWDKNTGVNKAVILNHLWASEHLLGGRSSCTANGKSRLF